MKRGAAALVIALTLNGAVAGAQTVVPPKADDGFRREWFETRPWFEPLIAEPRGAHISLIALAISREFPYSLETGARRVWDINLGKEVPFVLREKGTSGDAPIAPGAWGFGFWVPVSVHLVEDFHDTAHPILNTDYRFGVAFKIAHGFADHQRDRIFFKAQFGHESSHVGDEFLLNAIARYGPQFERVDVTSQALEGGISWDHVTAGGGRQLTLRTTMLHTLPRKGNDGYYVAALPDGAVLTPSARNYEPAVGFEMVPLGSRGAGLLISLDARLKTVYDYHKPTADTLERAEWSYSLVAGVRPLNRRARGTPEFVLKGYYGVNPNGLFRTQMHYWLFGGGLNLRV